MIEKKIVLVLGAGASRPFGFPLGKELANHVVASLVEPTETDSGKLLLDCHPQFSPGYLKNFAINLRDSHRDSVDAFLEHNPDFLRIGRLAIAGTLIPYETPEALQDGNWYRSLFNAMNAQFEAFGQNKLAVITYNYDRSLEFYLCNKLQAAYCKDIHECRAVVSSIPIVHLHGKMGSYVELGEGFRPYDATASSTRVLQFSSGIKIINESIDHEPQFAEAHRLISEAEIIC